MSKEKAIQSKIDIETLPNPFEKVVSGAPMPGEFIFQYDHLTGEKVIRNGDSYIVMGKDNPGGGRAGHAGETNAAAMDLVVG